jgi:lipoprotein LpqH
MGETVVKCGSLVAVCGAAIVLVGLAGCSDNKSGSNSSPSSSSRSVTVSASATSAPSAARVVIDGQYQNVQGKVTCTTVAGNVTITIGEGTTGIAAVISDSEPPVVHSVALGNVNGAVLGYQEGVNQGNAQATKDGHSYRITGVAAGVNTSDLLHPVTKSFEIDVTCP